MWYIHTVEYYTAMKRNKPKLYATMWMNLTNYKDNKRSQTLKSTCYKISSTKCLKTSKITQ